MRSCDPGNVWKGKCEEPGPALPSRLLHTCGRQLRSLVTDLWHPSGLASLILKDRGDLGAQLLMSQRPNKNCVQTPLSTALQAPAPHPPRTLLAASSHQPRAVHGLLAPGCSEATPSNGHVGLTLQGWLSETPGLMEPPIETRPLLGTLPGVGGGLPTAALCSPPHPACSISTEGVLAHTLGNPGIM